MTHKVALVGGGRMGGAMLRGWAKHDLDIDLSLFEPNPSLELAELVGTKGWQLNPDPTKLGVVDVLIVGVKPQTFAKACEQTIQAVTSSDTLVISIMAGISTAKIADMTQAKRVIRAMPNTPGQIGEGITAYVCGQSVADADEAFGVLLMQSLGGVERLTSEKQMDAVTAVSGSGPAYVFLLTEALAAAGEAEGLERGLAERLAWQTIVGSAALMATSEQTPLELRQAVTSPEGTTAAAIDVLTGGGGLVALMRRAVEAAATRSRHLGR
jgi:pyrroline-5-carboxylate reductase